MFTKRGVLSYAPGTDEDTLMEAALEAGAEDIVSYDDGAIDVFTSPIDFYTVKEALDKAGFVADNAEIAMIAATKAELDLDTAEKFIRLIDTLEDHDDVQEVYHNAEISDEVMANLG
ncbi:hypothetical protein GCM10025855_15340 [Shewanella glacialipiscicola]|uniref:TACO1/YebC-like second and third domain-containing protein n=1 Tax=Shewanella glacialipiscicola TaxID=614069 RepID=A0ABQ6J1J6_9GAMM|nr:hypothetical protein GCM10025855_15340 [Shewanella glacialipiscicola]